MHPYQHCSIKLYPCEQRFCIATPDSQVAKVTGHWSSLWQSKTKRLTQVHPYYGIVNIVVGKLGPPAVYEDRFLSRSCSQGMM